MNRRSFIGKLAGIVAAIPAAAVGVLSGKREAASGAFSGYASIVDDNSLPESRWVEVSGNGDALWISKDLIEDSNLPLNVNLDKLTITIE